MTVSFRNSKLEVEIRKMNKVEESKLRMLTRREQDRIDRDFTQRTKGTFSEQNNLARVAAAYIPICDFKPARYYNPLPRSNPYEALPKFGEQFSFDFIKNYLFEEQLEDIFKVAAIITVRKLSKTPEGRKKLNLLLGKS